MAEIKKINVKIEAKGEPLAELAFNAYHDEKHSKSTWLVDTVTIGHVIKEAGLGELIKNLARTPRYQSLSADEKTVALANYLSRCFNAQGAAMPAAMPAMVPVTPATMTEQAFEPMTATEATASAVIEPPATKAPEPEPEPEPEDDEDEDAGMMPDSLSLGDDGFEI